VAHAIGRILEHRPINVTKAGARLSARLPRARNPQEGRLHLLEAIDIAAHAGRSDAQEAAIDPNHDGHLFSFYYRSRLDIGLATTGRFHCEDLRTGCPGMVSNDGRPPDYSYVAVATTPDGR
jgi:hypothetical protein